ncbi:MAG: metallophosphoesterase, partial [Verrucomicrobiota bacterium]
INEEQVDVIFLVGDYISRDPRAMVPLGNELRNLRSSYGTFGVLGNHDRWHFDPRIVTKLSEAGVQLLINEAAEFDEFACVGLDSIWAGHPELKDTLARLPQDKPVFLAWHEPDTFDTYEDDRVVLQMSGHTHGGQVCAPVQGPILLPEFGKNYPYGVYERGHSSLFVTRGIGTLTIPTRFLCAPEVAILTLRDLTRSTA